MKKTTGSSMVTSKPKTYYADWGNMSIHDETDELADSIIVEHGSMFSPEEIPELIEWLKSAQEYFAKK